MNYRLGAPATPGASDMVSMPLGTLNLNNQQFTDFNFTTLPGFPVSPPSGTEYVLIDAGTLTGSLGAVTSGLIDGIGADLLVQPDGNGGEELVLAVPEPSTLAILVAGALGLLGYAWRRRRTR